MTAKTKRSVIPAVLAATFALSACSLLPGNDAPAPPPQEQSQPATTTTAPPRPSGLPVITAPPDTAPDFGPQNDIAARGTLQPITKGPIFPDPDTASVLLPAVFLPGVYDIQELGRSPDIPEPDKVEGSIQTLWPEVLPDDQLTGKEFWMRWHDPHHPVYVMIASGQLNSHRTVVVGANTPLIPQGGLGHCGGCSAKEQEEWTEGTKALVHDDHSPFVIDAVSGATQDGQIVRETQIAWLRDLELAYTPQNSPLKNRKPAVLHRALLPQGPSSPDAVGAHRLSELEAGPILGPIDIAGSGTWIVYVTPRSERTDDDLTTSRTAEIRATWLEPMTSASGFASYVPYTVVLAENMLLVDAVQAAVVPHPDGPRIVVPSIDRGNLLHAAISPVAPSPDYTPRPLPNSDGSRPADPDPSTLPAPQTVPSKIDAWSDLTVPPSGAADSWPTPSPDGLKIAFFRGQLPTLGDLWSMTSDGTSQIRLTEEGAASAYSGAAVWDAASEVIAYTQLPPELTAIDLVTYTGEFRGIHVVPHTYQWPDGSAGPVEILTPTNNRVLSHVWSSTGDAMVMASISYAADSAQHSTLHGRVSLWAVSLMSPQAQPVEQPSSQP